MKGAYLVFVASLALLVPATDALACAACGCGDPTLTSMGTEKPLQNRVRVSLEGRQRTDAIGRPSADELRLVEQRIDLQAAWAPHQRVFLALTLPVLRRSVRYVNLATEEQSGLGDVVAEARVFLWQDRAFAPTKLISVLGGLKLPTSPQATDATHAALPLELQPGTGSFDPIVGVAYATFSPPWSTYASATARLPTAGREGSRASRNLRATVAGQRQWTWLALRAAVDARLDGRAIENGQPDPDSGGVIVFAGADLLVSPMTDLLIVVGARAPVWNGLFGAHHEGAVFSLALARDF
jgi:hypothetical protein